MSNANNGAATGAAGEVAFEERFEDQRDAKPWLDALKQAQGVFEDFHDMCDSIDKLYANLKELKQGGSSQMNIFWANLQTLGPAIYARPPEPAVTPAFKDRKPLPRAAAEVMERALMTSVRKERMHRQMKLIRNDVARHSRGVMWPRMTVEQRRTGPRQRVKYDHLNRRDFVHEPAREWDEVGWVAKRAWLRRKKFDARFGEELGGEVAFQAGKNRTAEDYNVENEIEVWEIWSKDQQAVIWVTPGFETVLDIKPPPMDFEDFYPCPEPAYGTLEPDTLIPVPDFAQYKTQIEDINRLTARISALTDALKVRGFYPAGAEDIGDTIEKALNNMDDRMSMEPIPIPPGADGLSDLIEWLPLREVAETIKFAIEERRQLIEDVEQIVGISDIMRGTTEASETATAQQLKAQFGNVRVRDKTEELARLAEDGLAIGAEIIAEHFDPQTIKDLSQTDLPLQAEIQQQLMALQQQAAQLPQEQHGELQKMVDELTKQPTFEKIIQLFRNERMRPFVLEVRTDSTIRPNEDAEKARRNEFMTALGAFFEKALPVVQAQPKMAPFMGELLIFMTAPYRPGRQMQQAIDDLVDELQAAAKAAENAPPPPEVMKAQKEIEQRDRELDIEEKRTAAEIAKGQAEVSAAGQPPQIDPHKMREIELQAETDRMRIQGEQRLQEQEQLLNAKVKLAEIETQAATQRDSNALAQSDRADAKNDASGAISELKEMIEGMQELLTANATVQ